MYAFRIRDRPTGLANYTIQLSRALRRVEPGIEIVLLSPHRDSKLDWYSEFPVHWIGRSSSAWNSLITAPFELRNAARRLGLDVVHAPANVAPFLGPMRGVARIATIHDLAPLTLPAEHRLVSRLAYALSIPPLRWTADAVLTGSESAAADLMRLTRLPARKVFVTPHGVELPTADQIDQWRAAGAPELGLGPRERYFLFVGDIRPRKNLPRVLEAFAQLRDRQPDVRLVLVGQSMHRAGEIESHARNLGDALLQPGYADDQLLHRLYAGASAVLLPSLAEGFGLPALEAMAHGTTPIVSDIPVLRDLVADAGIVVDRFSPDQMMAAMEQSLHENGAHGRRQLCVDRASRYTWEESARKTLDVYRLVITRRE